MISKCSCYNTYYKKKQSYNATYKLVTISSQNYSIKHNLCIQNYRNFLAISYIKKLFKQANQKYLLLHFIISFFFHLFLRSSSFTYHTEVI